MAIESSNSRMNTNTRANQSKAKRSTALAVLAKRRNSIAARKQSVNEEKQSVNEEPSRALVLYNPVQAIMSSGSNNLPTFDDIKKITIGRSTLEKWYSEPFFDELISGCFVRLSIGQAHLHLPVYRLCMVRNMDATKTYRFYRFGNRDTCKYLNLVWGNDNSTARWTMTSVVDSPPLEAEFGHLLKEANRFGGYLPTRNEVYDKIDAIRALNSSIVAVNARPIAKNIGTARNDMEARYEKAVKMAELNRKNKIENFKNASSSIRKSADTSVDDPFARRWTKSRNYFAINSSGGETSAKNGEFKVVALEKVAAGSGKLVDTDAPIDRGNELNKLHDFEMSVSLAALERFGGARGVRDGYMSNKRRIEAAYGVKVELDDPAKHPYAMSVEEYRKRRGLI